MILTRTDRPVIKSFHELLKQTAGSDEVSDRCFMMWVIRYFTSVTTYKTRTKEF